MNLQLRLLCYSFVIYFALLNKGNAQVSYATGFEAPENNTGWIAGSAGGNFALQQYDPVWSEYMNVCSGNNAIGGYVTYTASIPAWSTPVDETISPSLGTSNGGEVTFSYDYKLYTGSGASASALTNSTYWGSVNVYYGTSASGPWVSIDNISNTNHVVSNSCATRTVTFTPPIDEEVYIRFRASTITWGSTSMSYSLVVDNVSATQGECISDAPTANAAQTFCEGATVADLQTEASTTATVLWYADATGGTALDEITVLVNGTTYYAAQIPQFSCESDDRTAVTATVAAQPVADVPSDVEACGSYTLPALTVGSYYTGAAGAGTQLMAGYEVTASTTIYIYAVADANADCTDENSFTVTINESPDVATTAITQPTCSTTTGELEVTTPLGTQYTYSIDGVNYQSSPVFETVVSGTYQVMVMLGECTSITGDITIDEAPEVPVEATVSLTQPTCSTATGEIEVTVPLGADYEYSIDGVNYQSSPVFEGVVSGTYQITVMLGECTSTTEDVIINEAPEVPAEATVSLTQPTCSTVTGEIEITAPLGTQYTYSVDGVNYQSSPVFEGVASGTYQVTVMVGECTSTTEDITIEEAPEVPAEATVSLIQPTCSTVTGEIEITAPLGTQYAYSIDGVNYQSSPVFETVVSGTYQVTVMLGECTSTTGDIVINEALEVPEAATVNIVQPECVNSFGAIEVTAPVGTGYEYSIDGVNFQSSVMFVDLEEGVYTITVQNTDGCTSVVNDITINTAPIVAAPTADGNQVFCNSATVEDLAAGGSELVWYDAETGGNMLTNETELTDGVTYYVAATNGNCESTRVAVSVTINVVPAPTGESTQEFIYDPDMLVYPVVGEIVVEGDEGATFNWYASEEDALLGENALDIITEMTDGGTYYVTQTIDSCESEPLAVTVSIVLNSSDTFNRADFTYHPNPVKDILNLSYQNAIDAVQVYNLLGQKVLEQSGSQNNMQLDMSQLEGGNYIVKVISGVTTTTIKVIKE